MTEPRHDEKSEKDEKESTKQEEKTMEEKWRRDPLGRVIWAGILIWAGLVFLAENLGLLSFVPGAFPFGIGVWGVILAGAGIILLIEVVIRLLVPAYRQPVGGTVILALVFIGIGLGNWFGWNLIWPIILIAIGLSILLRAFLRR